MRRQPVGPTSWSSLVPRMGSWGRFALCRVEGSPHWWDDTLDLGEGTRESAQAVEARQAKAKEICRRCPVRGECLDDTDLSRDDGVRFGERLSDVRASAALRKRYGFSARGAA